MRLQRFVFLTVALASVFAAQAAQAAQPDPNGQRLFATCAGCHGTNGAAVGSFPSLAGQSRDALVNSMNAFKAGARHATIMHQIAKGYTDEQIEAIATYLAAQKK